jgi:hypothetical protein
MIPILERIQKTDQPRRLGSSQNIPFDEDMLDLVHLSQGSLLHLLQSTDLAGIRLSSEIDRSVSSLADLYT